MNHNMNQNNQEQSALERFGTNLTKAAKEGKLDPVIGRDAEIRRLATVLSRRTKNNPVLVGDAGVGKTAIIEGLARRIVSSDVSSALRNTQIYSIDISAIVAGAKYRGELEERVKAVFEEIKNSDGKIIPFIDELHTLMGAGGGEQSVAAANILKPMLARGQLRLIGATTHDEYVAFIEKDAALERRFQKVTVDQPSVEDTISILRGLKEKYENHHKVSISDSALVAASVLSARYIPARKLPDKAIDLVDEAASKLRIEIDSSPIAIDSLRRSIDTLKIESLALAKEKDKASKERKGMIDAQIAELSSNLSELESKWKEEQEVLNKLAEVKAELDSAKQEVELASRDGNLEKASRILYSTIPKLEKQVDELSKKNIGDRMLSDTVTEESIASVISAWTGIPLGRLQQSFKERLINLERELHNWVVGQDDAVSAVANAIRRSRSGISEEGRPTGSFLFLGPTGVGKTELAKALARLLFDDPSAIVRLDMSEYSQPHSVSRLIGSPPGYIGFEEGGQLTEAVRRRPYCVVLFDEVEKAHPQIFNTLLQVLDEGRLTDSHGRCVDFSNTILVLTSNLGYDFNEKKIDNNDKWLKDSGSTSFRALQEYFRPEFLNRLDEIINFKPLSESDLLKIVDIRIRELENRTKDKLTLVISPDARKLLAHLGTDPIFGARPLRRVIQKEIEDKIAIMLLEGKIGEGSTVRVGVVPDGSGGDWSGGDETRGNPSLCISVD